MYVRGDEGYLLIDNRCAGEGMIEAGTYTCAHCERIVIKNYARLRERYSCKKCNRHICDNCAAVMARTLECVPMAKIVDDVLNAAVKAGK
jgi:hypothetical protein